MNTQGTGIGEPVPATEGGGPKLGNLRPGLAGRLRTLVILGSATLIAAAIAGRIYGWPAAAVVIAFVSSICGLAKGLIELHLQYGKLGAEPPTKGSSSPRMRELIPVVIAALLTGVAFGAFLLPRLVEISLEPSASLRIPAHVDAIQLVTVTWHNVPTTDEVRVLVLAKGSDTKFIQPCRGGGSRRGMMSCEVEIGGRDDASRVLEVRVVRMPNSVSEQYVARSAQAFYPAASPEETQVIDSAVVTRN